MISFPNAKINIGLNITERRPDGFHNLETVFFPVGWSDILEIADSDRTIFTTSGITISGDPDSNLVMKAYRLLQKEFNLPALKIHLHKQIPFGAGLGGGSSDAAHMLLMLNKRFELKITEEELLTFAATLGSDCPFFILNQPVFATGRGDIMNIINLKLNGWWLLLVKPQVEVSTIEAYRHIVPQIPENSLRELINLPVSEWKETITNQFETSVFLQHNDISELRKTLYALGAEYASMSGSGSSVFGLFRKPLHNWQNCFPSGYLTFSQQL